MQHSYVDARPSSSPRSDESVVVADGRRLHVARWGDPGGEPVLFLHGRPGSRRFCPDLAATERRGVDLVTFDRAGYGRSDARDGVPSFKRSVDDVLAVVDHLGIDRLAVIGFSGGGPHALAVGAHARERVTSVSTVCSPSRPDMLDADDPAVRSLAARVVRDPVGERDRIADRGRTVVGDGATIIGLTERFDPDALDAPGLAESYRSSWDEATVRSWDGFVDDWILGTREWDFGIDEVEVPIQVWFGERDVIVPEEHARWIAERARRPVLHGCPHCRHYVAVAHWPAILDHALRR